jgi:hypothetical protein
MWGGGEVSMCEYLPQNIYIVLVWIYCREFGDWTRDLDLLNSYKLQLQVVTAQTKSLTKKIFTRRCLGKDTNNVLPIIWATTDRIDNAASTVFLYCWSSSDNSIKNVRRRHSS